MKLPLLDNSSQTELGLLCFMLTLRSVVAARECSFAEVAASKPCLGTGAGVTEKECRHMSEECCILEKSNGDSKCFRAKKKQPSADGCRDAPILSKPMLNQCLEGDVTLEVQVVSELQCWDYCIRQKDCTAYNYYHAIGQSLKTCQLLSKYVGLPISQKGCTHHIVHKKKKNIKTLLRNKCR